MNQYTYCVVLPENYAIFRSEKNLQINLKKLLTKGISGGILAKRLEGAPRNWQEMEKEIEKISKNLLTSS